MSIRSNGRVKEVEQGKHWFIFIGLKLFSVINHLIFAKKCLIHLPISQSVVFLILTLDERKSEILFLSERSKMTGFYCLFFVEASECQQ